MAADERRERREREEVAVGEDRLLPRNTLPSQRLSCHSSSHFHHTRSQRVTLAVQILSSSLFDFSPPPLQPPPSTSPPPPL